jgi:ABC-2 type transport system permease protein
MKTRVWAIAHKELLHIVRDWRTLALAFVQPMLLNLLFGYAITFDIKHLKLAVADEDRTYASRELVRRFTASDYFRLTHDAPSTTMLPRYVENGDAQIALGIPKDFAKTLEKGNSVDLQVIIDGAESNTAEIASAYVDAILSGYNVDRIKDLMGSRGLNPDDMPPVDAQVRVWFNPTVDSPTTIVPGLIAVIMIVMTAMLSGLTIVRERELGSLESLFATPVRRGEILIGKMLPFLAIAMMDCVLVAVIGIVAFNVPFRGSPIAFGVTALVFSFTGLAIGIFASVISSTQVLANQIVVLSTMLPSMMLSGFMVPIESMPWWVQNITRIFPARYFVQICRGVLLKAQPWPALVAPTAYLLAVGAVFFTIAVTRFRKKL